MKKILFSLLISLSLQGQVAVRFLTTNNDKVAQPPNCCIGDKITVNFTLQPMDSAPDSAFIKATGINQQFTIWRGKYSDLNQLPNQLIGQVMTKKLTFSMPNFYYNAPIFIECDGDLVYTNMKHCNVGIDEQTLSEIPPTYYDLQGNIITEKHPGQLLIWRRGIYSGKEMVQ